LALPLCGRRPKQGTHINSFDLAWIPTAITASGTETPAIEQSQAAVTPEQPTMTIAAVETPAEPVTPIEPVTSTKPSTEPQAEPVASSVQTNRTPDDSNIFNLANIPAQVNGIRGNGWYRSQPRTSYTLQLISASQIENVLEILDNVPGIQSELSGYVKYTPSGKPRYLMFYGLYVDKATADAAIANLPAGVQAVNPWSRSIGNITDEMDTVKLPAPQ